MFEFRALLCTCLQRHLRERSLNSGKSIVLLSKRAAMFRNVFNCCNTQYNMFYFNNNIERGPKVEFNVLKINST